MVRKIVEKVPTNVLMADLERYQQEVIEWGATDAKIISSSEIVLDERVAMKCRRCAYYGTNLNCPPYCPTPQEMREIVNKYRYAVFFTVQGPPAIVAGPREVRMPAARKVAEIASRLEGTAFYEGYYLSLGFATGSCKSAFCSDIECPALKLGQACIEPLKARSSPEGVGMDVYLMATRVGWDIYPCGVSTKEEDVPLGRRCGLVLIY